VNEWEARRFLSSLSRVIPFLCWLVWAGVVTLHPFEFDSSLVGSASALRSPAADGTSSPVWWVLEALLNVVLFMPLGFLASRLFKRGAWHWSIALGLCVAGSVEVVQLFLATRQSSVLDVLFNLGGTALGVLLSRYGIPARGHPIWILGLLVWLGTLSAISHLNGGAVRLTNWSSDFSVALEDEVTGNRPYAGQVRAARLCTGSGEGEECMALEPGLLPDSSFVRSVLENQDFLLSATVISGRRTQEGPARIVTWSLDSRTRNLTLGQDGTAAVLRVRTDRSNENGTWPSYKFPEAFENVELGTPYRIRVKWTGDVVELRLRQEGRDLYSAEVKLSELELLGLVSVRGEFLVPRDEDWGSALSAGVVTGIPTGALAVGAAVGPGAWILGGGSAAALFAIPSLIDEGVVFGLRWVVSVVVSILAGALAVASEPQSTAGRRRGASI